MLKHHIDEFDNTPLIIESGYISAKDMLRFEALFLHHTFPRTNEGWMRVLRVMHYLLIREDFFDGYVRDWLWDFYKCRGFDDCKLPELLDRLEHHRFYKLCYVQPANVDE